MLPHDDCRQILPPGEGLGAHHHTLRRRVGEGTWKHPLADSILGLLEVQLPSHQGRYDVSSVPFDLHAADDTLWGSFKESFVVVRKHLVGSEVEKLSLDYRNAQPVCRGCRPSQLDFSRCAPAGTRRSLERDRAAHCLEAKTGRHGSASQRPRSPVPK